MNRDVDRDDTGGRPPWRWSAAEQIEATRAERVAPLDVVSSVVDHTERLNPVLHAFCTVDPDGARRAAAQKETGPLRGVAVSIKDLIETAEMRTTYGSRAYADRIPEQDDVVVERLRAAGASILGKTNTSEFGYIAACHNQLFPTTRNPWATDRTPGGSSGGAAAAVAAGLGPIAIGSDGGGSVRLPAALCGIVGFKGSFGVVPAFPGCRDPRLPGASSWETLECLGILARTVTDVGLTMDVIAGPDPRDRHSIPHLGIDWRSAPRDGIAGTRVALCPDFDGLVAVDPEVRRAFDEASRVFSELGCEVVNASPRVPDLDDTFGALIARDSDLRGMRAMIDEIGPKNALADMVGLIRRPWTAEEFTDAAMMQQRMSNELSRFMRDVDLLVTPTVPCVAFDLDVAAPTEIAGTTVSPSHFLSFVRLFNMTRQPAISVPAGFSAGGLPVGLQIVGRPLEDRLVLAAAGAYETARPWADVWPSIVNDAPRPRSD